MITVTSAVNKRMREILDNKDMSAYRLGKDNAIPRGTIKAITGEANRNINLKTVLQLVRALGIKTSEFFDDPIFDSHELDID